jgi:polysaccharide biosynthesis/export protein
LYQGYRMIHRLLTVIVCVLLAVSTGCYAPLRSPGIAASTLPEGYRVPVKTFSHTVNYAMLTAAPPAEYLLSYKDLLRVEISDLAPANTRTSPSDRPSATNNVNPFITPVEVRVSDQGTILLPLVGSISVDGLTLEQARQAIAEAYSDGYINDPKVGLTLVEEATNSIIVLGEVKRPETFKLPKFKSDVAHALAFAGGLTEFAGDEIQVHRRRRVPQLANCPPPLQSAPDGMLPPPSQPLMNIPTDPMFMIQPEILRISLRSLYEEVITSDMVTLMEGDVVIVPRRKDEVFFVVGRLNPAAAVRFTTGRDNRDLGNGFLLPPDRDVDVVTAVAMAGYIDPIDSPTTVSIHRTLVDGSPTMIHVDLIKARYDRNENIFVRAGDIIYLNPDAPWWIRRTFDRIVPDLFTIPYAEGMGRLIFPNRFN